MAAFKPWQKEEIVVQDGRTVEAIAPVILSASRASDVPAFHGDWFMTRIRAGYFKWINPFNANQVQVVSLSKARVVVFWSKNPQPLIKDLDELDQRGIQEMDGLGRMGESMSKAYVGCLRMTSHSSAVNGPGFCKM